MRTVYSAVQALDIDKDREDEYIDAVRAGQCHRETYKTDEIGQKDYHIQLIAYTDPDGQRRWAVTYDSPNEVDYTDTSDVDEAITAYETYVRAEFNAMGEEYEDVEDGEGNTETILKSAFDYTDVTGIPGNDGTGDDGNLRAYGTALDWADATAKDAERLAAQAAAGRALALVRYVDAYGSGGPASAARKLDIKPPTVTALLAKGRKAAGTGINAE